VQRASAALGALYCAMAVGLGAWAAHAVEGLAQGRLETAVLYLFLHGLGLLALAPLLTTRTRVVAAALIVAGSLLFCGSLVAAAMAGVSTRLAPFGGVLLIAGWLMSAVLLLQRR
jgi:uncharacterized membrane protein YgdD (TMEM256/DUF423 family)